MSLFVKSLQVVSVQAGLDVSRELLLVGIFAFFVILQMAHVVSNVSTKNVGAQDTGVEFLLLLVVADESLLIVIDVDTTVGGTLHGGKNTGTSGGTCKTDIEEGLEWTASLLEFLDLVKLSVDLFLALVLVSQVEASQQATSAQKTSGIGGGIVGQTESDSMSLELMGIGAGKNNVTDHLGGGNLAANVLVANAYDESVFGAVVLVLVLADQSLAGTVVSLTLPSSTVFGLEAFEVSSVLDDFNETHGGDRVKLAV